MDAATDIVAIAFPGLPIPLLENRGRTMDIRNLFKGATVSVKSIGGKKQVWVQAGKQLFPIANLTGLEEEMVRNGFGFQKHLSSSLRGRSRKIRR
jgi:hypothetical protein